MAISPEELPAVLRELRDKAAVAAEPCVMAMAGTFKDRLTGVTLRRYSHPPATKTPSPPGQPPAWMTGELARSVTSVLGPSGGMTATATVGPHTVYARIQEYGGSIRPVRARFLRWTEDGIVHYSKHVRLPPRPYMRPAIREVIEDGSLTRAAAEAFMAAVWG